MRATPKSLTDAMDVGMDMIFNACSTRNYKPAEPLCELCLTRTSTLHFINGDRTALCGDCYEIVKADGLKKCDCCEMIFEEDLLEGSVDEQYLRVCSKCNDDSGDNTDLLGDYHRRLGL